MKKLVFSRIGFAAVFVTVLVFFTFGSIFANAQTTNEQEPVLPLPGTGTQPLLGDLLGPSGLDLLVNADGDLVVNVDPISALLQLNVELSLDGGQTYLLAGSAGAGLNSLEIEDVVCGTVYTVRANLLDTILSLLSGYTTPQTIAIPMCDAPIIDVNLDTEDNIVVEAGVLDDLLRLDVEVSTDGLNFLPIGSGEPGDNIFTILDPVCGATYTIRARVFNLVSQLLSGFSQPQIINIICNENGGNATSTPNGGGNPTATPTPNGGGGNPTATSTPNGGGGNPTATPTDDSGNPTPPTLDGFRILNANQTSVTLGWNAVTRAGLQIYIERSLDLGMTWAVIAMLPGDVTSFADSGLASGVTYAYRAYTYEVSSGLTSPYTPTLWHTGGTINLLLNGSFEVDVNADRLPDAWKDKRLENDKVVSNGTGSQSTRSKTHSVEGNSAFRFKAPTGQNEKLIQQVLNINGLPGDELTLTLMAKAQNLAPESKVRAKLVVYRPDGTKSKTNVQMPTGSYEYIPGTSTTYVASHEFSNAKVILNFKSPNGKWWVDDVKLIYKDNN
jgi:hypothetical protein